MLLGHSFLRIVFSLNSERKKEKASKSIYFFAAGNFRKCSHEVFDKIMLHDY